MVTIVTTAWVSLVMAVGAVSPWTAEDVRCCSEPESFLKDVPAISSRGRKRLLLDDHEIDEIAGVRRTLHRVHSAGLDTVVRGSRGTVTFDSSFGMVDATAPYTLRTGRRKKSPTMARMKRPTGRLRLEANRMLSQSPPSGLPLPSKNLSVSLP